jgi:uncharacterized protein involved in exopolysaccharide biosynthesis
MHLLGNHVLAGHPGFASAPFGSSPTAKANRRRLVVFAVVFALAAAAGLGYTFLRPAEYRATARLQITPGTASVPAVVAAKGASTTPDSAKPFLFEVEVLTSQPVLEQVVERLQRMGWDLSVFGPDQSAGIKAAVQITPAAGTNVVEVAATGPRPQLLAALVNTLIEAYTEHVVAAHRASSGESMAQVEEEARKLEADVAAKRRQVEQFRLQHNIVSLEREENQVLARVRGQGTALNTANERVAAAEGKLRSLQESAEAGKSVVRARDNPTLANLEKRASEAREELRELERTFTADYLAMDPKARAMRTRLAELEQQIKTQRTSSQQAALVEAQEEVSSARQAAQRIEQQMAADRQEVGRFTTRFNEYKSLQEELTQLEGVHRDAVQRRAMQAATVRARTPSLQVLESAIAPRDVWRPLYARDAALSLGAALALALLALWIVELFNRPEPQPSVLIAQPVIPGLLMQSSDARALAAPPLRPALEASEPALLTHHGTPSRELGHAEVAALLEAADGPTRLAASLVLSGVTPEEALALERSDIDLARRVIKVRGGAAREIELSGPVAALLPTGPTLPGTKLLALGTAGDAGIADLGAAILCAAHDANVERASDVTPECLRHTYIAFLVRQGLRFADLTRIVGPLPSAALAEYSALAPPGPRVGAEAVDRLFPPLGRTA